VIRRANNRVLALLATGGLLLGAPAVVRAASGGAVPAPSGGTATGGPSPSGDTGSVKPGNMTVRVSGNGITVLTRASAILRRPLEFTGNAGSSAAGDIVEIERRGRQTGWTWAPTTHGIAGSDGSFSATWPVNHIGQFAIRAVVERGRTAEAASVSPTLTITVYRPSLATIYGPGFWGQRTACGHVLRRTTLGVANRTLRCGTPVALYWHGRTIVVPVIDRGPYAHGADWDLTEATAAALGIEGTETIGAVSLPR
jgi:rare lipoprotein A